MLRAHLIMNPEARGVTPSLQHLMATALEARFELGVTETHARDAGVEVARRAVDSGAELLIAFGGDGLVNEVVNGMAGSGATPPSIPRRPMNVFAPTLRVPPHPPPAPPPTLAAPPPPAPPLPFPPTGRARAGSACSWCGG